MTVNDAVAVRISALLKEKGISQYRLEQDSEIQHGSMQCIMNGRNKTVTLSTVILLAKGFGMTLTEFLDDDILDQKNWNLISRPNCGRLLFFIKKSRLENSEIVCSFKIYCIALISLPLFLQW